MSQVRIWVGMALLGALGCTRTEAPTAAEGRLRLVQFAPLPVAQAAPAPIPAPARQARLRPVPRPPVRAAEPVPVPADPVAAVPVQAVDLGESIVRAETMVASLRPDGTLVVDVRVLEGTGGIRRWERTHLEWHACPCPESEVD